MQRSQNNTATHAAAPTVSVTTASFDELQLEDGASKLLTSLSAWSVSPGKGEKNSGSRRLPSHSIGSTRRQSGSSSHIGSTAPFERRKCSSRIGAAHRLNQKPNSVEFDTIPASSAATNTSPKREPSPWKRGSSPHVCKQDNSAHSVPHRKRSSSAATLHSAFSFVNVNQRQPPRLSLSLQSVGGSTCCQNPKGRPHGGAQDAALLAWKAVEDNDLVTLQGLFLQKQEEGQQLMLLRYPHNLHQTLLHLACSCSSAQYQMVLWMLRTGADVNAQDDLHFTPLHLALKFSLYEIAKLLICFGAKVHTEGAVSGSTLSSLLSSRNFLHARGNASVAATSTPSSFIPKEMTKSGFFAAVKRLADMEARGGTKLNLSALKLADDDVNCLLPCCKAVTSLNLRDNRLVHIPPLHLLPFLKAVKLEGNPLPQVPQPLVESANCAFKVNFARAFHEKQPFRVPWKRIRMIVVGKEGVGKTSFIRSFVKNCRAKLSIKGDPLSTEGIDISHWKTTASCSPPSQSHEQECPYPAATSTFHFSVWDFGGQEVFFDTHQFFLGHRALYVLVFNVVAPDFVRVKLWLDDIRARHRFGVMPVVMVGTHADLCSPQHISRVLHDMEQSVTEFSNVSFITSVSCVGEQSKVTSLMDEIAGVATQHSMLTPYVPYAFTVLNDKLSALRKGSVHYISKSQFWRAAGEAGLKSDEEIDTAARFLHDMGFLFWFPAACLGAALGNVLKNTVILSAQWLAEAVSQVVSVQSRAFVQQDGILPLRALRERWIAYTEQEQQLLLELLYNFDLAVPLTNKSLLFPSMLSQVRNTASKAHAHYKAQLQTPTMLKIKRIYEFQYFPFGLMGRVIAKILNLDCCCLEVWKFGCVVGERKQQQRDALLVRSRLNATSAPEISLAHQRRVSGNATVSALTSRSRAQLSLPSMAKLISSKV